MAPLVRCPLCDAQSALPAELSESIGQTLSCPACGEYFVVGADDLVRLPVAGVVADPPASESETIVGDFPGLRLSDRFANSEDRETPDDEDADHTQSTPGTANRETLSEIVAGDDDPSAENIEDSGARTLDLSEFTKTPSTNLDSYGQDPASLDPAPLDPASLDPEEQAAEAPSLSDWLKESESLLDKYPPVAEPPEPTLSASPESPASEPELGDDSPSSTIGNDRATIFDFQRNRATVDRSDPSETLHDPNLGALPSGAEERSASVAESADDAQQPDEDRETDDAGQTVEYAPGWSPNFARRGEGARRGEDAGAESREAAPITPTAATDPLTKDFEVDLEGATAEATTGLTSEQQPEAPQASSLEETPRKASIAPRGEPGRMTVDVHTARDRGSLTQDETSVRGAPRRRGQAVRRAAVLTSAAAIGFAALYGGILAVGGPAYDSLGVLGMFSSVPKDEQVDPLGLETPPGEFTGSSEAPLAGGSTSRGPDEQQSQRKRDAMLASFDSPSDGPADERLAADGFPSEPADDIQPPEPAPFGANQFGGDQFGGDRATPIEPAAHETPADESAATAADGAIAGAPEYGFEELQKALVGAEQARIALAEQSLANPEERTQIGRSYAKLCEVAQVLSFLAPDSSDSRLMMERLAAQDIFTRLFRHQHARDDALKIAQSWLEWTGRPHGGIFFCSVPVPNSLARRGSYYEYHFPLANGEIVKALTAEPLASNRFFGAKSVGIVGCVIESPAERIAGYTGDAKRAVLIAHAISLDDADME